MARRSVRRPKPPQAAQAFITYWFGETAWPVVPSAAPSRPKPPKPKASFLAVEQKRRRIERFKKCIRDLEAFDPQKVQKRFGVPEVVALEAAIDKALLSAFGHGTSAYMR